MFLQIPGNTNMFPPKLIILKHMEIIKYFMSMAKLQKRFDDAYHNIFYNDISLQTHIFTFILY